MIVSAALCPSPPLLARELTGQALVLPELHDACAAAVAQLTASAPDLVIVVGSADVTATWDASARLDLSAYAPGPGAIGHPAGGVPAGAVPAGGVPSLPLAVGIGAMLLNEAGYPGPRSLQGVAASLSPAACLVLGRDLAAAAPRVALLVMGEGTARRSPAAPGYLDERAEPFDAAVERAVRDGDLAALAKIDPVLADDLMATGRPAWQVLAGALTDGLASVSSAADPRLEAEIRYCAAPFGVAYLVATLATDGAPAGLKPDRELDS
jgi:hypothetical protein